MSANMAAQTQGRPGLLSKGRKASQVLVWSLKQHESSAIPPDTAWS